MRTLLIDFSASRDYFGVMLLYPFWVLVVGAVSVFAVARLTKHRGTTLLVAMLFFVSAMSVLVAFTRFTETASLAIGRGLFLFEVSRLNVLACLIVLMISGVAVIFYVPHMEEDNLAQGSMTLLLVALFTVGSVLSADPLSFAILLGGVPLFVFMLARIEKDFSRSPYLYLLVFIPSVMLILFTAFAGYTTASSRLGPMPAAAALVIALVLAAYLLLYPFGLPTISLLPLGRKAAPVVMSVLPGAAFFGLIKFLPLSMLLGQATAFLAGISAVAWGIMCYRSKERVALVQHSYLAQTSAVGVMIVCALSGKGMPGGEWFLILSNHLAAGLGLLLSASLGEERRGWFAHVAVLFFAFCFLGLPPSPGFFGRLHLFLGSFGEHGLFGYLLRLSFLVNLFLVYCLPKSLAASSIDTKSAARMPWSVSWALGVLAGCLLLSMLLRPYIRAYLAASGL